MKKAIFKKLLIGVATLGLFATYLPYSAYSQVHAETIVEDEPDYDDEEEGHDEESDEGLSEPGGDLGGDEGTPTTDPTIKLVKTMNKTAGYKPTATDSFTVQFTQVENLKKYWGGTWNENEVVAPKTEVELPETSVAGTGTTESIDKSKKTASADYKSFSNIKTVGIYTYEVTEKSTDSVKTRSEFNGLQDDTTKRKVDWIASGEKYILKIKVTKNDQDQLQYLINMLQVTKDENGDDNGLATPKATELDFSNTLRPRNTEVTITHKNIGQTPEALKIIPGEREYKVKVTVSKPADYDEGLAKEPANLEVDGLTGPLQFDKPIELTFKASDSLDNPVGKKIKGVPVGSKITISETDVAPNSDNPNLLGNVSTKIARDTTVTGLTETEVETTNGKGATASNLLVTLNGAATGKEDEENSFTVTDTYRDIINTGIKLATSPFVVLLAIMAAAGGMYIYLKRKVRN